jgi:hypothetical protein
MGSQIFGASRAHSFCISISRKNVFSSFRGLQTTYLATKPHLSWTSLDAQQIRWTLPFVPVTNAVSGAPHPAGHALDSVWRCLSEVHDPISAEFVDVRIDDVILFFGLNVDTEGARTSLRVRKLRAQLLSLDDEDDASILAPVLQRPRRSMCVFITTTKQAKLFPPSGQNG